MESSNPIGIIVLLVTFLITYKGFKDLSFRETYIFHVDPILFDKDYKRLVTSGFLHANWIHFGFNMIALISFVNLVELTFGPLKFFIIYFASMIGGSLLALYIHRHHGNYRALGASGAISGVVFASIILNPTGGIGLIFLPDDFSIPSWLFGALFILISIFGIKSQSDNIGHEAHLGGAIIGALLAILFMPSFRSINWWVVIGLLAPTMAFLILIVRNPNVLLIKNYWGESLSNLKRSKPKCKSKTPVFINKEAELNFLLEKIKKSGKESLTKKEAKRLEELTKEL